MNKIKVRHQCMEVFEVEFYQSHGETIICPAKCPGCGHVLTEANTTPTNEPMTLQIFTEHERIREPEGFSQMDAQEVVKEYVCGVCQGQLTIILQPNQALALVVCPEHGSVEKVGRVTRSTVMIELERAHRDYRQAVRNLADLWPGLQEPKKTEAQILHELGY
jgi:hypothetical protein